MCPGSAVMLAGMWSEVRGGKGPLGTQGNVCLRKISLSEHEPLGFVFTSPLFIFKDAIFWVHRKLRMLPNSASAVNNITFINTNRDKVMVSTSRREVLRSCTDTIVCKFCIQNALGKNALNSDPPTKQPNTKSLFYLYKHLYAILLLHWTS